MIVGVLMDLTCQQFGNFAIIVHEKLVYNFSYCIILLAVGMKVMQIP
jgi:hypothetical protein